MTMEELIKFTRNELSDFLLKPAETLYSARETLSKGDIYLLGTNPGGSREDTLADDLNLLENKTTNGYLDESWKNERGSSKVGESVLQRRVQYMFKRIGYETRSVCASNLIFLKSTSIGTLGYDFYSIADKCWSVHEKIIEMVQPKVIIVFGNATYNSPYAYLKKKFIPTEFDAILTGHGTLKAKSFEINFTSTQKITVIGLPHLSRFNLINDTVYDWIKKKIS